MLSELILILTIASIVFYRWATKHHECFKKRHIPYDEPIFLLGSGKDIILRKKSVHQVLCEIYNRHDGSVYGTWENRNPVLLIRDPDIIKNILIKDFDHFVNRPNVLPGNSENILTNSLFFMQNEKWRDMRSTLSPAFTGSKMRQMFELILQKVDEGMLHLNHIQEKCQNLDGLEVDMKDFTTRLTNDVIASTAFGLEVNSFRDKENIFYMRGRNAMNFTVWQQLKMTFIMLMPKIAEVLSLELFDKNYVQYFMHLVLDAIKYRLEHNIHRPDMINLLMEAKGIIPADNIKSHYRNWTDTEMVAQCFLFFFAGLEPTSATMSFAAHELMEYPEVQQKLYEEIHKAHVQLQGNPITYDVLNKMTYMDMVVSEVLRKWPVTLVTDRVCNKDYRYDAPDRDERLEIKKGEHVRISMCAVQRDPKYFDKPDVLNPDRFSEENKSNIISGTYLPFGVGPRNCIGNRFALLEIKAFLYYLVRDYRVEASKKSCIPMELDAKSFQLKPKNGFWLKLKKRN